MPTALSGTSTNRAGLCPHGLPPAACPICSGGGMGGAGRMRDTSAATKPMKSNEWSWIKCYTAGIMMRAQEARTESAKLHFEQLLESAKQMQKTIDFISDKIRTTLDNIQNSVPKVLSFPLMIINKIIINPILNLITQIPKLMEKLAYLEQNLKNMLQQAGEKLVSLIGDLKNFVKRKLEDIKKQAKKFFLFFISNNEDENYRNDEALAVFKSRELKKYLLKILKTSKKQKNNDDRVYKE